MSRSISFDLPMPPSVNALYANVRGVGRVKTSAYRKWITEAQWMLVAQRNRPGKFTQFQGDVAVSVQAYRDKRRDLDNILKGICDLLQSTGTIANDNRIVEINAKWVDEGVPCTVTVREAA